MPRDNIKYEVYYDTESHKYLIVRLEYSEMVEIGSFRAETFLARAVVISEADSLLELLPLKANGHRRSFVQAPSMRRISGAPSTSFIQAVHYALDSEEASKIMTRPLKPADEKPSPKEKTYLEFSLYTDKKDRLEIRAGHRVIYSEPEFDPRFVQCVSSATVDLDSEVEWAKMYIAGFREAKRDKRDNPSRPMKDIIEQYSLSNGIFAGGVLTDKEYREKKEEEKRKYREQIRASLLGEFQDSTLIDTTPIKKEERQETHIASVDVETSGLSNPQPTQITVNVSVSSGKESSSSPEALHKTKESMLQEELDSRSSALTYLLWAIISFVAWYLRS